LSFETRPAKIIETLLEPNSAWPSGSSGVKVEWFLLNTVDHGDDRDRTITIAVTIANDPLDRHELNSDVRQKIKVFGIFVGSALTLPESFLRFDEANLANPLDHLEPELIFDA